MAPVGSRKMAKHANLINVKVPTTKDYKGIAYNYLYYPGLSYKHALDKTVCLTCLR